MKRTLLFDTGPEDNLWAINMARRNPPLEIVDRVFLSHWHRDHTGLLLLTTPKLVIITSLGGLICALRQIQRSKYENGTREPVVVDLHPDRPDYRGFRTQERIVSLEADPTFEEIEQTGAKLHKDSSPHHVLGGMFLASGEIPRQTSYELGLQRGMRFDSSSGKWQEDQLISDERFLVCKIRG